MIFLSAAGVLRYFLPLYSAGVCALAAAASAAILLGIRGGARDGREKLSEKAREMFFELMFESDLTAARRLYRGVKKRDGKAVMHGGGVYLGSCAMFCSFSSPPEPRQTARLVRIASRYGAKRITVLCERAPDVRLELDSPQITYASGEEVYTLLASLSALPRIKHEKQRPTLRDRYKNALAKDKALRYAALSATLIAVYLLMGTHVMFLICGIAAAALAALSATLAAVSAARSKANARKQ